MCLSPLFAQLPTWVNDIAVKMFFIQGKTDLYQIMAWTTQEKEYTVMPILEKAALSFDEY